MKATLTIWLLSGALVASAGLNVYRARPAVDTAPPCAAGARPCAASSGKGCPLTETLGLTDAQRRELVGCCGGMCASKRDECGQQIRTRIAELERELNKEELDRAAVARLADEIAQLRAQEWKNRIQCILQVRETLTPAQVERLVESVATP